MAEDEEWDEFIDVRAQCRDQHLVIARRNLDRKDGDWVDPMMFAADYTVAAATGFQVWEGCWAMVELLEGEMGDQIKGQKVLELGSGTGLGGLCAAAIGAHCLCSDVETVPLLLVMTMLVITIAPVSESTASEQVTDYSLKPNIDRNASSSEFCSNVNAWPKSKAVGLGSARGIRIDWTEPVEQQAASASVDLSQVQFILAAECVWLQELVDPFVKTVLPILRANKEAQCFCCYRDRAKQDSETFAGMEMVVEAFQQQGCKILLKQRKKAEEMSKLKPEELGPGNDFLLYSISMAV